MTATLLIRTVGEIRKYAGNTFAENTNQSGINRLNLYAISALELATKPLPSPCCLLRMADSPEQIVKFVGELGSTVYTCDLIFNDASSDYGLVRSPTIEDAKRIISFAHDRKLGHELSQVPNFVAQCQAGIGRSQAVVAALAKIEGKDNTPILRNGTYNRKLYRLILEAAGVTIESEPLVSMVVRLKYAPETTFDTFMNSMLKQRYQNWEVVAVTDGPCEWEWFDIWTEDGGWDKFRLVRTPKPLGRWGHPYRQLGIDAARGDFIGLSNDDNYYTPGYLEQMVLALQTEKADIVMCPVVHSYSGWSVTPAGSDLGCWLARAEVVKAHPWTGVDFDSDQKYLAEISKGRKVVTVNRPLFVHC
jgi:hypothetical protein